MDFAFSAFVLQAKGFPPKAIMLRRNTCVAVEMMAKLYAIKYSPKI
jgi:hypothetical protein